jgi:hypothetical protein
MSLLPLDGPATYANLSVSTTAVEVKASTSVLSERKIVTIQPLDGEVYFGYDSSVTSSNGTKIFKGQVYPLEAGELLNVFIVADSGTVDVRITEVS